MKENKKSKQIKLYKLRRYILLFQKKLGHINIPEYTSFSIFAILTGAAVGLAAVLFHHSIEFLNHVFFGKTSAGNFFFLGTATVILLPAAGMLIQSLMIKFFPETASKKGIAEVIKAVALRGGFISFRTTLFHFIAPVICIGTGGTVGPEGPAAQLGGGISSKLGNLLGMSDSKRRMFTAAGAGAAISAIFNTPLGGIFFALEIILLNDFHSPTFSALILASVTASAISRIFLGNQSVFSFELVDVISYGDFYLFIILGLLSGLLSILFIRYFNFVNHLFRKKVLNKFPQWTVMPAVGLLVGICGYFYEDIFGFGYSGINHILSNSLAWNVVGILLILKFILVPLVLNSGGFGGIFAPSLFMGACFGFLFAYALNTIWGLDVDYTTFILVAMGSVLAGINSIPIAAILIIFEMTKNYSFILPLMLAVVISTMIVQLAVKGSIHLAHLEAEGFHISHGRETSILRSIQVKDAMKKEFLLISENTTLPKLISLIIDSPSSNIYVFDENKNLSGVVTENELRPIISEYENLKDFMIVKDIINPNIVTVRESDNLDEVMNLFSRENLDEFPVVSQNDPAKIAGVISRQDVINSYNKASLKYNVADGLAKELKTIERTKASQVTEGYSIVERECAKEFAGKTLSELKLRNIYGLEVLMIKRKADPFASKNEVSDVIIPDSNYVIEPGDIFVLFGKDENIEKTNQWQTA